MDLLRTRAADSSTIPLPLPQMSHEANEVFVTLDLKNETIEMPREELVHIQLVGEPITIN